MPVTVFNTISELNAYIAANIAANGTNAITGPVAQEVLQSVTLSLLNIVNSLPGSTVNEFEPWDGGTTYTGGDEVVVRHNDQLWLFVSGSDSIGTEPGTNGLVWQPINAVQLAHFRNQDQYLDFGGSNQVSALELRRMLATAFSWRAPVDWIAPDEGGGEPVGYTYAVEDGATGAFAGFDGNIAVKTLTGWSFYQVRDGDSLRMRDQAWLLLRISGAWQIYDLDAAFVIPPLGNVTAAGNTTASGIVLTGAPLRHLGNGGGSYALNSPGDVLINYSASCVIDLIVSADGTVKTASFLTNAEFWMLVRGAAGGTLTWDPAHWQKSDAVTLPTVVGAGEEYILHCFVTLGKVTVVSCGEIVAP